MIEKDKNQNDILSSELSNFHDIEYIFNDKPINRIKTKPKIEEKSYLLDELRKKIENIKNGELKSHAKQLIFSDEY